MPVLKVVARTELHAASPARRCCSCRSISLGCDSYLSRPYHSVAENISVLQHLKYAAGLGARDGLLRYGLVEVWIEEGAFRLDALHTFLVVLEIGEGPLPSIKILSRPGLGLLQFLEQHPILGDL